LEVGHRPANDDLDLDLDEADGALAHHRAGRQSLRNAKSFVCSPRFEVRNVGAVSSPLTDNAW
jgi:hypothetical protein